MLLTLLLIILLLVVLLLLILTLLLLLLFVFEFIVVVLVLPDIARLLSSLLVRVVAVTLFGNEDEKLPKVGLCKKESDNGEKIPNFLSITLSKNRSSFSDTI